MNLKGIKEYILFKAVSKNIRYLGIYLTNEVRNHFTDMFDFTNDR